MLEYPVRKGAVSLPTRYDTMGSWAPGILMVELITTPTFLSTVRK